MAPGVKRVLGIVIALGAAGGAVGGMASVDGGVTRKMHDAAKERAEAVRDQAKDKLLAAVGRLEGRASAAANIEPLKKILLQEPDAKTLEDGFRNEEWWAPIRSEFKVYSLLVGDDRLDFMQGMARAELKADAVVAAARSGGIATGLVLGANWPYAAAAAKIVGIPGRAPVILLAKPIDEAWLKDIAMQTGGAVALSSGGKLVVGAGPPAELGQIQALVGKEAAGTAVAPDSGWAAAPAEIVAGLWLWTVATPGDMGKRIGDDARTTKAAVGGAAGLVALLALLFGFRRDKADEMLADTTKKLQETQAQLAKLSTGMMGAPGAAPQTGTAAISGTDATAYVQPAVVAAAAAASAANVFGRYTLIDRLGEGGMAEVYTAVTFGAEGFKRQFVVKRLRAELARESTVVSQFIDEAKLGSTLIHSNIIPVFDFGKVGDEYFLAQEYILGRDLGRVTRRHLERGGKPLPPGPVLFATHETLKALEYAHGKLGEGGKPLALVHRDVSPNNILLSARGEVKLFDFGIVKAEGRVTQTQHGVVKGNVSFMSPEQARGQDVDGRADLFSLGLVMYFCLAGDVLYQGNTTYELLVKAATGPGAEEKAKLGALPAPARDIIARALEVDPARRYQSAAEFAAAIAPHIAGAAAEVSRLMSTLFGDDFKQEEAHFAAAVPGAAAAAAAAPPAATPPAPGVGGGTKAFGT